MSDTKFYILVVTYFCVGVWFLVLSALLKLHKVKPRWQWGYSPVGNFLLGIGCFTFGISMLNEFRKTVVIISLKTS